MTSTLVEATYPSKVASTGVLQGDAANANVSPAKYAWTPDERGISVETKMLTLNKWLLGKKLNYLREN